MTELITLFSFLLIALLLNIPVAFALGISSIAYLIMFDVAPIILIAQRMTAGIDSFPLLAIPLFLLAGGIMARSEVTQRIVDFASSLVGRTRGGLAMVAVLAAMFFGALSGSGVADVAAIGALLLPHMKREGYRPGFSCALLGTAGSLGTIIPPSIVMIIYGTITNTSIGALFVGGVIPGALCAGGLLLVAYIVSRRNNWSGKGPPFKLVRVFTTFRSAVLPLLLPVIVIGGIKSGFFTPTEAGAVAVMYAFILGTIVYRTLSLKDIRVEIVNSAESTAAILFIVANASLFGWILTAERAPEMLATYLGDYITGDTSALLLILGIVIFLGTFMETISIIIILAPLTHPIILGYGIDPVLFGVLLTIALAIGANTPPLGIDLMAACRVARIDFFEAVGPVLPFLLSMVAVLVLLIMFPGLVLFLPSLI